MKLFIYGTLKNERILEKALGESHGKKMTPALVFGYLAGPITIDHRSYPSIWKSSSQAKTQGEIIEVTEAELKKLDEWEDKYQRRQVETSAGPAWTYIVYAPRAKTTPLWVRP